MLRWSFITRATYDAGVTADTIDTETLYYISDTSEIFRGKAPFNQACAMFGNTTSTKPTAPATNKLYFDDTTLAGWIYTGGAWKQVVTPLTLGNVESTNTTLPVSGAGVVSYVAAQIANFTTKSNAIKSLAFNTTSKVITPTMADGSTGTAVTLSGIGVSLAFDSATGALTLKDVSGNVLGSAISLDLERFVSSASYDPDTKKITLSFNDASTPLVIDVASLVDTYTVTDSTTIDLTMTSNAISGTVKLSATSGNAITSETDGLFVDISGKIDKMASATAGKFVVVAADGKSVAGSSYAAGGSTLAATPNASTLATEIAVNAVKSALETAIAAKMAKVAAAAVGQIIIASSTGDASASGKTLGGASMAASPTANVMATELGVKTYADAKVSTALTWNTTV